MKYARMEGEQQRAFWQRCRVVTLTLMAKIHHKARRRFGGHPCTTHQSSGSRCIWIQVDDKGERKMRYEACKKSRSRCALLDTRTIP